MDALAALFSSRSKAGILRLLFVDGEVELYLRELERRTGLSVTAVRHELQSLLRLGIVAARTDGNRTYFKANRTHPIFPELKSLVAKTSGLDHVISEALGVEGIDCAFIFGSLARNEEKPGSDVDLMVIGSVTLRQVVERLTGVSEKIGRELNPHVFTPQELAKRIRLQDHFIHTVMDEPKRFVLGDERELERVGRERLAASAPKQPKGNSRPAVHRGPRHQGRR